MIIAIIMIMVIITIIIIFIIAIIMNIKPYLPGRQWFEEGLRQNIEHLHLWSPAPYGGHPQLGCYNIQIFQQFAIFRLTIDIWDSCGVSTTTEVGVTFLA